MNKLEEYIDEQASSYANKELNEVNTSKAGNFYGFFSSYCEGFDAAIALDLPVKFAEWAHSLVYIHSKKEYQDSSARVYKTMKDAYQCWIDNIYKIE